MTGAELGGGGNPDDVALAGEYVLRLLDPGEAAECRLREAREPAFAALTVDWRARLAAFDAEVEPVAPARALWGRIEARLWDAPASRWSRIWNSAGLWRGLAAASVLAAIWLAALAPPEPVPLESAGVPEARLISAVASGESAVTLVAVLERGAAALSISRISGEPAPGRSLELWLIEGEAAPVSLGVLPETPQARVPLGAALAARIGAGAVLAISDEPAGGSPDAGPSGPVVATGALTEI